jgi:hypothetical protein
MRCFVDALARAGGAPQEACGFQVLRARRRRLAQAVVGEAARGRASHDVIPAASACLAHGGPTVLGHGGPSYAAKQSDFLAPGKAMVAADPRPVQQVSDRNNAGPSEEKRPPRPNRAGVFPTGGRF